MRLLLVRHGQSEWNASRRLQGQADVALSEEGRRQADALRPTIEAIAPDRAISSDLARVRETAERIGAKQATFTSDLREIDVGDWTGKAIDAISSADPEAYAGWRAGTHAPPGGEDWSSFVARVGAVIEREQTTGPGETLLVVCHGGVIRALIQHLLGLPPARIIPVAPASLTLLQLDKAGGQNGRLELFNYRPGNLDFEAPD
ncbi:MAG: histidine phosphatase family protein [Pseudomonadota bacterium]